ncbi:MAG: BrnA antitoxin family protein [Casimicrobiaceae bacterium]
MSVKRTTAATVAKGKGPARKRDRATTDWQRLREMTDDQAEHGAAGDPANAPTTAAWLAAGQLAEPVRKRAISLRLDPDVVDWFRTTGPRYQSRMNAVLRAFVQHQRHVEEPTAKRKRIG